MSAKAIIRLTPNPEGFGTSPDELTQDMFTSAIPVQHSHEYYEDPDIGLYIGIWDTETMVETAGPYANDEYMWLLDGECEVKNMKTGEMEKVVAGEAFIIPRAYDCQWHQTGYLRKFYVISENPAEPMPAEPEHEGILILQPDGPLSATAGDQPFAVIQGAQPRQHVSYKNVTGKFISGTWVSEAFESELRPFPFNELAYVQAGSITLTDAEGRGHLFNTGDAFFIPEGVMCSAAVTANVSLSFAVIKSA